MAKFTRQAIIYSFMDILSKKKLDKITVKDICELCQINRNTFYYYFEDIYAVLYAVFEMETENVLKSVTKDTTFFEQYKRSAAIIFNNRSAVIHIYQSRDGQVLQKYLEKVVSNFVRRFVLKAAEGEDISEKDIDYITRFYSYGIIGSTIHWIEEGIPEYSEDMLKWISDSFEATIPALIKNCKADKSK